MSVNNGAAECKPQTEAAPAVADGVVAGKEHFKYALLQCIRNTRAMVADLKHGSTVPAQHRDMNLRTRRRILDGVIYKIHQHLNDQPCIHPYQQRFIAAIRRNRMFRTSAVDMPKRFRNDVLRDLIG